MGYIVYSLTQANTIMCIRSRSHHRVLDYFFVSANSTRDSCRNWKYIFYKINRYGVNFYLRDERSFKCEPPRNRNTYYILTLSENLSTIYNEFIDIYLTLSETQISSNPWASTIQQQWHNMQGSWCGLSNWLTFLLQTKLKNEPSILRCTVTHLHKIHLVLYYIFVRKGKC